MGSLTGCKLPGNAGKQACDVVFRAGFPQVFWPGWRHLWTALRKNPGDVDNPSRQLPPPENNFFNFSIMHKKSEVLPAGRLNCLRLADGEPL